jgi:dephospho-CoA kinase
MPGLPVVVLDIPLLFEARGWSDVDKIVVVSAPSEMQRERVLSRPGMTEEKFERILERQMPDAEKRARADFVISSAGPIEETRQAVRRILACLKAPADS